MNCNDARELLSFYLDQELSASAQQELTKHLQACPACARELEELRMTTVLLASWEEKEPPPGLHQGVMSRLWEAVASTTTSKSASGLAFAAGEPPLSRKQRPLSPVISRKRIRVGKEGWGAPVQSVKETAGEKGEQSNSSKRRPPGSWWGNPYWRAAAVFLIALGLNLISLRLQGSNPSSPPAASGLVQIRSASPAKVADSSASSRASGGASLGTASPTTSQTIMPAAQPTGKNSFAGQPGGDDGKSRPMTPADDSKEIRGTAALPEAGGGLVASSSSPERSVPVAPDKGGSVNILDAAPALTSPDGKKASAASAPAVLAPPASIKEGSANGGGKPAEKEELLPLIPSPVEVGQRQVEKARVNLVVGDTETASSQIEESSRSLGGQVLEKTWRVAVGVPPSTELVLAVPSSSFPQLLNQIDNLGSLRMKEVSRGDASDRFNELVRRLQERRQEAEELNARLLRAADRGQVPSLEQDLARVQGEIWALREAMTRLGREVEYPTVTVLLEAGAPSDARTSLWPRVSQAFAQSLLRLKQVGQEGLIFLVGLLPWLLVVSAMTGLAWVAGRWVRR